MLKNRLYLLIPVIFLFASCDQKVVESKFENGKPKVVKYYKFGSGKKVVTKEISYYENEKKRMEGGFKDGEREGYWQAWYEDGTLWSEGYYRNGKRNGVGITYYKNGQKFIEGFYQDDEKKGIWHIYDENGKMMKEVNFDLLKQSVPEIDTID